MVRVPFRRGVEERAGDVEGGGQGVQPGVQGAAGCFGAVPADPQGCGGPQCVGKCEGAAGGLGVQGRAGAGGVDVEVLGDQDEVDEVAVAGGGGGTGGAVALEHRGHLVGDLGGKGVERDGWGWVDVAEGEDRGGDLAVDDPVEGGLHGEVHGEPVEDGGGHGRDDLHRGPLGVPGHRGDRGEGVDERVGGRVLAQGAELVDRNVEIAPGIEEVDVLAVPGTGQADEQPAAALEHPGAGLCGEQQGEEALQHVLPAQRLGGQSPLGCQGPDLGEQRCLVGTLAAVAGALTCGHQGVSPWAPGWCRWAAASSRARVSGGARVSCTPGR